MNTRTLDLGLFLIRLILGVVFLFHGAQKLFGLFGGGGIEGTAQFFESLQLPVPTASAVVSGLAELLGGLALVLGAGTRVAALVLTVNMAVAALTAHSGFAAPEGMEYPLTLAVVALGLACTGSGRFALRPSVMVR